MEYQFKQQLELVKHQNSMAIKQQDERLAIIKMEQERVIKTEDAQRRLQELELKAQAATERQVLKETSHTNRFNAEIAMKDDNLGLETNS